MISDEQLSLVSINCPGYDPLVGGLISALGVRELKTCKECQHFQNDDCSINIFNTLLYNIGQN